MRNPTPEVPISAAARGSDDLLEAAGLVTKAQLARSLGISTRTLDRLHVNRKGPPRVRVGRKVLYRRESVLTWLAGCEKRQTRAR